MTSSAWKKEMSRSWRVGEKEYEYLRQLLDSGFPGSEDTKFVEKLEAVFAEKFGCKYAISHNNGTATLHSALAAAGVGQGDEVIVPPLTMASTSLAVLYQNAVPVFADIDPQTFTIDPASIRDHITRHTRAIISVALYGLPPDMDPIMELSRVHDLVVIQDSAQCFLGRYKGKIIGSIAHLASFSFQKTKHITCGEGGMVTTNNLEYADRVARFANLGYSLVSAQSGKSKIDKAKIAHPSFKRHVSLGYNYSLSELCAAVALAQLERLEELVRWRQATAAAFDQVVRGCSWLTPQYVPEWCEHSYWAYAVSLNTVGNGVTWEQFYRKFLDFGGDGFYGAWSLTYLEPMFQNGSIGRKYEPGICPVAEKIQPRLMHFKTHYGDQETIDRQAEALQRTIRYFDRSV